MPILGGRGFPLSLTYRSYLHFRYLKWWQNPPKPPQTSKALPFVLSWWTNHRSLSANNVVVVRPPLPFALSRPKRSRLWSNLLPSHRPLQQSHLLPLALGEAVSYFGWRKNEKVPLVVGSDFFVCSCCCFAWWMAGSYKMIVVLISFEGRLY